MFVCVCVCVCAAHAVQDEPLTAHAVVCTLPLGCLQKGTMQFEPPLPGKSHTCSSGMLKCGARLPAPGCSELQLRLQVVGHQHFQNTADGSPHVPLLPLL